MEIEKDKLVEINRKGDIGTFVYVPSNYLGPIAIDATVTQSTRNRKLEDVEGPSHIPDKGWPDKNAGYP